MAHLVFVTGLPGVGKTSVLLKAAKELKKRGFRVGGMASSEAREGGVRVGFEIVDVSTGRRGWLAHVNQPAGPKVGKYRVNLNDLDKIGAVSIIEAVKHADIIVVDEIGPMELFSFAFKDAIVRAMESGKTVMGTIHQKARDPLIATIKSDKNTEILEVTYENRDRLHNLIIDRVLQSLGKLPFTNQDNGQRS